MRLNRTLIHVVYSKQFREAVGDLAAIYKEHIRLEDEVVFPIAGRTLSAGDKTIIAAEMMGRRK